MCNSEGRVSQVLLYLEEICDPAAASDARPKRSDSASSADDVIPTEDGIATTLDVRKSIADYIQRVIQVL